MLLLLVLLLALGLFLFTTLQTLPLARSNSLRISVREVSVVDVVDDADDVQ